MGEEIDPLTEQTDIGYKVEEIVLNLGLSDKVVAWTNRDASYNDLIERIKKLMVEDPEATNGVIYFHQLPFGRYQIEKYTK